jgi:hypothetical protein
MNMKTLRSIGSASVLALMLALSALIGAGPAQAATNTELLAPFASGQTGTVVHGYNDPLPGESCVIGSSSDHCQNQKYAFDIRPSNQTDARILAPMPGTIAWISGNCLGLTTTDGYNLNVCHFGSYNVAVGNSVSRGKVLGNRSTSWIHLSLDDRYRNSSKPPVAFSGTHTLEGTSYAPQSDTTRNQYNGSSFGSSNTPIP